MLRGEYHNRLNDRLAKIKLSIKIPKQVSISGFQAHSTRGGINIFFLSFFQALYMITQLQRHLIAEATQRQVGQTTLSAS